MEVEISIKGHVIRSLNELSNFNLFASNTDPGPLTTSTPSLPGPVIALEPHKNHGPKPIMAVISKNHPYILATLFATWKLGGIFAPLDLTESVIQNIVKGTFFLFYFFCQPLMGNFY